MVTMSSAAYMLLPVDGVVKDADVWSATPGKSCMMVSSSREVVGSVGGAELEEHWKHIWDTLAAGR
jgi:hypothetical protein